MAATVPVPQKVDVERWTVEQVAAWLQQVELSDCGEVSLRRGIDGHSLLKLREEELVLWGRDVSIRNRKQILKLVSQINSQQHPIIQRHSHDIDSSGSKWKPSHQPSQSHNQPQHPQFHHDDRNGNQSDDDNDDDDGFSDDEFDDVEEEPSKYLQYEDTSEQNEESDDENSEYMTPLPGPSQLQPTLHQPRPPFSHHPLPVPRGPASVPTRHAPPRGPPFLTGSAPPRGPFLPGSAPPRGPPFSPGSAPPRGPPFPQGSAPSRGPLPPQGSAPPRGPPPRFGAPHQFGVPPPRGPPHQLGGAPPRGAVPPRGPAPLPGFGPLPGLTHRTPVPSGPGLASAGGGKNSVPGGSRGGGGVGGGYTNNTSSNLAQRPAYPIPNDSPNTHRRLFGGSVGDGGGSQVNKPPPQLKSPPQLPKADDSHEYEPVGSGGGNSDKAPPVLPPRNQGDVRENLSKQLQHKTPGPSSKRPPAHFPHHHPLGKQQEEGNDGASSAVSQPQPPIGQGGPPTRLPFPLGGVKLPVSLAPRPEGIPSPSNVPKPKNAGPMQVPQGFAPGVPGGGNTTEDRVSLGNSESVVLTPLLRNLIPSPYFHLICRSKSNNLLGGADEGTFLVRPSTRTADPLTLSLLHNNRIYNINIRLRKDGQFALGKEKLKELTFVSVDEMIRTHQREPLKLQEGERTILTTSPRKSRDNMYVTHAVKRN